MSEKTERVQAAWARIEQWLAEHAPLSHRSLLPPVSEEEIGAAEVSAYSSECTTEYEGMCTTAQATSVSRSMAWRRFLSR